MSISETLGERRVAELRPGPVASRCGRGGSSASRPSTGWRPRTACVDDSYIYVPEDQPEQLAQLIREFLETT